MNTEAPWTCTRAPACWRVRAWLQGCGRKAPLLWILGCPQDLALPIHRASRKQAVLNLGLGYLKTHYVCAANQLRFLPRRKSCPLFPLCSLSKHSVHLFSLLLLLQGQKVTDGGTVNPSTPRSPCGNTTKNCLRDKKALQHKPKMVTCIDYEVYIYFILFSFELREPHHTLIDFLHLTNEMAPNKCCSKSCIFPPLYVSYPSDYNDSSISLGFCWTKQEQMPWTAETSSGLHAVRVI